MVSIGIITDRSVTQRGLYVFVGFLFYDENPIMFSDVVRNRNEPDL